jgi:hypothetical protein
MPDDNRERRHADAANLLAKILPYDKVGSKARMAAIHNELMFSIDSTLKEQKQKGCRFEEAEIEVLRSIALQIVYLLDPLNRPRRGFIRGVWSEFLEQTYLKRASIIATVVVALVGAGWTVYREFWKPIEPAKPQVVAPTKLSEPPPPLPPPPTPPSPKK